MLNFISTTTQRFLRTLSITAIAKALSKDSGVAASVVTTTQDKASYLDLTLASLEHQIFPADAWKIVIVDEASADDTRAVLDKYGERGRLRPLPSAELSVCASPTQVCTEYSALVATCFINVELRRHGTDYRSQASPASRLRQLQGSTSSGGSSGSVGSADLAAGAVALAWRSLSEMKKARVISAPPA